MFAPSALPLPGSQKSFCLSKNTAKMKIKVCTSNPMIWRTLTGKDLSNYKGALKVSQKNLAHNCKTTHAINSLSYKV